MLENFFLLDEAECQHVRAHVYDLKDYWKMRSPQGLPFYTLGAASYIDAKLGLAHYKFEANKLNVMLWEHFHFAYQRLQTILSQRLDCPVDFEKDLALPGFHIFMANKVFEKPVASIHFDLQHELIDWKYQQIDFSSPISFTLSISLPMSGGGLNYWDISQEEIRDLSQEKKQLYIMSKEKKYFPYQVGYCVMHRGLFLHQIAPQHHYHPNDERITLQGHGLFCDGAYRLYW